MINQRIPGKTCNTRLYSSLIVIFTYFTGLGFDPTRANTSASAPKTIEITQTSTPIPTESAVLTVGSQGSDVKLLQTQLQDLKYYNGLINGEFDENTQNAVIKFQKAQGLNGDGKAGKTTRESLQAAFKAKNSGVSSTASISTPKPKPQPKPKPLQHGLMWWLVLGLGVLGSIGILLALIRWFNHQRQVPEIEPVNADNQPSVMLPLPELESTRFPPANRENSILANQEILPELDSTRVHPVNTPLETHPQVVTPSPGSLLPIEKTSRLAKVNIVDELIKDLRSSDPTKRNKAIWDLGQQGDSRAIQPLVDLMIDADSQEHGLILAALAEIGIRTLKPMNRALAISMEDESPQVRQNAIRDLTRVYDIIGQMSQILRHAAQDRDPEVQATAKYALNHLQRIRGLSPPEEPPEDSHSKP